MKAVLTILLITFLLISTLFSAAIISTVGNTAAKETPPPGNIESKIDTKLELPSSRVETLDRTQKFFITNLDSTFEDSSKTEIEYVNNEYETKDENSSNSDESLARNKDKENTEIQSDAGAETEEDKEEIKDGTIKLFLDGDIENGLYLGETTSNLESTEASRQYGEDFINTGFKFTIRNNGDLNLLPGSTHYIYIYFYTEKSGWDYIREEINLSGEENCEKKITICIEKPEENSIITGLQLIKGWAVDFRNKENPGIEDTEIYLDGPKGYGRLISKTGYGMPREDIADYFENQNYLNSGYQFEKSINLEPGSIHTIFIYAFSSKDNSFNYEKRDIYLSGMREEKAIISARVNTQNFRQDNIIEITGHAIDKNSIEEKLETEKETGESNGEYTIKKIIFNSNRDGNENIYSININGTELTGLTDSSGSDMYPEVSPDGNKIAYTSDISGVWQIMIMDWDGKNKRQITRNNFRSAFPSWSYNGKYIYFEAYIDGDWELYRIKSDGTEQKRLTFNPGSHDWHPNGHPYEYRIIYESGASGHENIYVMNHDGSGKRKICRDGSRRRVPDVSSNGSMITYMRYTDKNCDIWIMDYNGQNETRLTDNPGEDGHPAFSPDDKYIVYEERKGSRENLILIDPVTGKKINITDSPYIDKDGSFLYR